MNREEYKNLEAKVTILSETCIACRTALSSDVRHLNDELKETKTDVAEIKRMLQKMGEQIQALTIKVSIIVAVIVSIGNLFTPFIKNWIGK